MTSSRAIRKLSRGAFLCIHDEVARFGAALHREIIAAATDPMLKERLETQGVVSVLSPAEYAAKIANETKELAEVVAAANIKAE